MVSLGLVLSAKARYAKCSTWYVDERQLRFLQTNDTLRLNYGRKRLGDIMSLLAFDGVEDGNSSDTEPDALVDFTAMLMERENDSNSGWFGCGSKLKSQSQDDKGYYLGQYVLGVLDFSSQYGIDYSISYTAANVIGRPTKFPAYGDYPETFTMVSNFKNCLIHLVS